MNETQNEEQLRFPDDIMEDAQCYRRCCYFSDCC